MSSNGKAYGPANPHPLSQLRTGLVWEGKYDEFGNRREVDVAGCSMPMQKIETIDQPRSEAAAAGQLEMFDKRTKRSDDFRNQLIWGDNKLVMASLLKDFKGKVDLIYIDPPFDVGADFTMDVPLGDENETVEKDQSTLEMVAYRDTWGKGTDSYVHMMYDRLSLMKTLLSDQGSLYVHCDWRVVHYLKLILDELFGVGCFRNEIIWHHQVLGTPRTNPSRFAKSHESILWYSKDPKKFILNYKDPAIRVPWSEDTRKSMKQDEEGRWYYERRRTGTNNPWAYDPRFLRTYADDPEAGKTASDVWDDLPSYQPMPSEKTGYNTQKPDDLVKRIVAASSNEDSMVLDAFCGSGTLGVAAERLNRRWIMCDLGRFAIHISRKRLIDVQRQLSTEDKPYRAFDVYNLGRYERQWWQKASLQGADEEHRRVVLEFFQAEKLQNAPSPLIQGRKSGAFCHVDGIDSMFSRGEASAVAKAVAAAGGRECYCLAWEFEMDLRLTTAALEQELGVRLKLIQIPREIMERNRKSPPPFLEMAVLKAEPVCRGEKKDRSVDIKLTQFLPSLAEVPTKELEALKERAVKSGFDFIDFWAVDFDWHPDKPFNHHWQDYRTRKDRSLKTVSEAGHKYPKPGTYTACVKVVDVFGCDTSITVEVKV
jgi:DNA modification methylase